MRRRGDRALVTAAARGEVAAWQELVDRHDQLMRSCAESLTASLQIQDASCQLAWLRLAQRLNHPPRSVRNWLLDQVSLEVNQQDPLSRRSAAS
jgi:DNA-directed RNA polymerase specialized sigma24 family protein